MSQKINNVYGMMSYHYANIRYPLLRYKFYSVNNEHKII